MLQGIARKAGGDMVESPAQGCAVEKNETACERERQREHGYASTGRRRKRGTTREDDAEGCGKKAKE